MNQEETIRFFNERAPHWDEHMIRNDETISCILYHAGVRPGTDVLDVACGTGVLIPDYLKRQAASVTGIDISPEMIRIASSKFPQVRFLCEDVETAKFDRPFDCIMVYNAFPHFPDPRRLITRLSTLLKPSGTLTVAHGMSRDRINQHHSGAARHVSTGLMPVEELKELFSSCLDVTAVISDDTMYQVTGVRKISSFNQCLEKS